MTTASGKPLSTASVLCQLCDIFTRNELDGKSRELLNVYERRKNEDNLKEILACSTPSTRLHDLSDWHLERMAVGELGGESNASHNIAMIKEESRCTKTILRDILAQGTQFNAQRDQLILTMKRQREALRIELEDAKDFLEHVHLVDPSRDLFEQTRPADVEQRLLATVKPPEAASNVDYTSIPSI